MDNRLRVAIIGAGNWGYQHARAFAARTDCKIVGIAGRTAQRTQARAEQFHTTAYTDVNEMLTSEKPDFVSVCLPAQYAFETTMKVIEAGVPLLAEKPLAYRLDEAEALIERSAAKDLFFAINFEQRYAIPCLKAKQAIDAGRIGRPVFTHWRFGHGWDEAVMDHPYTNLIEAQCHGINLLEYFCGSIASVSCDMTDNGGRGSFSTFTMSLRYRSGAVGSFLATLDANDHNRLSQLIEIGGTDGRVLIEDNVQRYTYQATGSEMAETWAAGFFDDHLRSFSQSMDRYLDDMVPSFCAGRKPPVPASEGLRALQVGLAAIQSFQTRRAVDLPSV